MNISRKTLIKLAALAAITASTLNANASVLTNDPGETPFNLMLDTGNYSWQNPSSNLVSSTPSYSGSYSSTGASYVNTVTVDPLPGIGGSIDVFLVTPTTTYDYTNNYQNLSIDYSANLLDTFVPQSYLLNGEISKDSGANLISGGYSSIYFNMGLHLNFIDPYVSNTANGLLSFKIGSTPGEWLYSFQKDFSTSDSFISFNDASVYLNMNDPIFFEAEYSINGNPGIAFSVDNLSLNVSGGLGETTYNSSSTVLNQQLLQHVDIPALPVAPVPVPAAAWLMGSGLIGLVGAARRKRVH